MFKKKQYLSSVILLSIYFQKKINVLNNDSFNSNLINIKTNNFYNTPFAQIIEFNKTQASDIAANHYNNKITTNNLFYNYKWDFYFNFVDCNNTPKSSFNLFNNRMWLEREVFEFFNINYINLKDSRNLILNYNDNVNYLLKNINVQNLTELKTSWHFRKIIKLKNTNVEL